MEELVEKKNQVGGEGYLSGNRIRNITFKNSKIFTFYIEIIIKVTKCYF